MLAWATNDWPVDLKALECRQRSALATPIAERADWCDRDYSRRTVEGIAKALRRAKPDGLITVWRTRTWLAAP